MLFAESLARDISDYIKNLLNKESIVVDNQNKVIMSKSPEDIGKTVELPSFANELTTCKQYDENGTKKVLIPLRHENKNSAYLILDDDRKDFMNYSGLIKSFAELLIQQYYENNQPVLDSTDKFITNLFDSYNSANAKEFESEARIMGYDITQRRIGLIVYLKGFWNNCLLEVGQPSFEREMVIKNWKRNIENSINSFFTKNTDVITAYIGNDKFVVFKALDSSKNDEDNIKKLLKKSYKSIFEPLKTHRIESITVGFGNAYEGIDGLLTAKREAELTLDLSQKIWGENQSYYFGDLGLLSILGDGDRDKKITFSSQILSKLKNAELAKTLECFFDNNLNLTETADDMGIHRNTVIYRLNQITKILNADPRIFEQAMSIKIALIIKNLFG